MKFVVFCALTLLCCRLWRWGFSVFQDFVLVRHFTKKQAQTLFDLVNVYWCWYCCFCVFFRRMKCVFVTMNYWVTHCTIYTETRNLIANIKCKDVGDDGESNNNMQLTCKGFFLMWIVYQTFGFSFDVRNVKNVCIFFGMLQDELFLPCRLIFVK